jgi:hypothetical protein
MKPKSKPESYVGPNELLDGMGYVVLCVWGIAAGVGLVFLVIGLARRFL